MQPTMIRFAFAHSVRRHLQRGFTLIEVMVVLVIVMAMFGLKWMLEKYLLPHFSE